jgi:hypothetical protein
MGAAVDVTFHEVWPTDEAMGAASAGATRLEGRVGPLSTCRVDVGRSKGGNGRGRRFRVVVEVAAGAPLTATTAESEHARLRTAVENAFKSAGARLRRALADRAAA